MKQSTVFTMVAITFLSMASEAMCCSRFTYTAPKETVVVGRSMDWMEDIQTDLWVFPAGMSKKGDDSPNSAQWTSKYGSLIASGYHLGTADGINSEGLAANLLYLASSDYGNIPAQGQSLSVLKWAQYFLDNYATVNEAVEKFSQSGLYIETKILPNGAHASVHLSISDRSGDNAVFEYIKGKLNVYHGKQYNVMTNEPPYDKQLALNDYWQGLHGSFLPGTTEPADRFVRASYYLNQAPLNSEQQQSIAIAFAIIRGVSQPFIKTSSNRPNQAATLWRSVADLKHGIYYFENTDRPNVFWVDTSKLDFTTNAPVKKLPLSQGEIYAGEVSSHFIKSDPF